MKPLLRVPQNEVRYEKEAGEDHRSDYNARAEGFCDKRGGEAQGFFHRRA